METENTHECGEGCECGEFWGYDTNTYEEVNFLEHVKSGKTGFDEDWNIVSEFTLDALYKNRKGGKKGGGKNKGGNSQVICFKCGREGHRQADCRSTTILGKGKSKGKGKTSEKGKGKSKGKGKGPKGDVLTVGENTMQAIALEMGQQKH